MSNTSGTRRRFVQTLGAGAVAAIAGCLGEDEELEEDDDGDVTDDGDVADDEEEATETLASTEPNPNTGRISEDDIQQLVEIFDDQPMNDDQHVVEGATREYTPRHVWKWVTEETFIGLHFDEPNPEEATALDYITVGRKGLFTEESRPGPEFSHFHQHTAESWEAGHGGETGDEGYWLTHISARTIQYPFHEDEIGPRVDYGFFPTPPEDGSEGHTTDFTSPGGGEGSLSAEDRDALLAVFDDRSMNNDQHVVDGADRTYTPRHAWLWLTDEVVAFLHFDEPNPEEASELDYFGIGVRGQFDEQSVPARQTDEFSHFHKHTAESWEAGHGAQSDEQYGFWLVHHNVRPVNYPFHDDPIDIGVDRDFFPTPL